MSSKLLSLPFLALPPALLAYQHYRSPYPPTISTHLRTALIAPTPLLKIQKLHNALKEAHTLQIQPTDTRITGIWILLAQIVAENGNVKEAIQILEQTFTKISNVPPSALTTSQLMTRWIQKQFTLNRESTQRPAITQNEKIEKLIGIAHTIGELANRIENTEKAEAYFIWIIQTVTKYAAVEALAEKSQASKTSDASKLQPTVSAPGQITLTEAKPTESQPNPPKDVKTARLEATEVLKRHAALISPALDSLAVLYRSQGKHAAALQLFGLEYDLIQDAFPCRAGVVASNAAEAAVGLGDLGDTEKWLLKADTSIYKGNRKWIQSGQERLLCRSGDCVLANSRGKVSEVS